MLALQGGYAAHARLLRRVGAEPVEVRTPAGLEAIDALVLPGGESTTMTLGIAREGLADPLRELCASGRPVLATCAGLILLDRDHLGVLPVRCARNAFGRQVRSFEADLEVAGLDGGPMHAVFIRAPQVVEHEPSVDVLASVRHRDADVVVSVGAGPVEGHAFHPELGDDDRLHRRLVERVRG